MLPVKIEDYVRAKHFRVFVFNENGFVMMVQGKGRWDIPFGKVERDGEELEEAVRRVVFVETKTNLNPIVPVNIVHSTDREGNEVPVAILTARMDGEAQIKEDEKTHHRLMEEKTFLMQAGYRNKLMRTLLEEAKNALFYEEVRMAHDEETQEGTEKYNYKSLF